MAGEDAPVKGSFDFMKTKLGPLPIAAWGAIFLVIWYVVQHKKTGAATGQQTDAAGNTGTIDPATGFVYGSTQDQAGLAANAAGGSLGGTSSPSSTGSSSTTAGQYSTNSDWGRAAVNYLVGLGIDPTVANQSIQQYLSGQTLTTEQQGTVNLAIQSLGAPPQLPTPSQQNPTPVVTPPSGTTNATNPPTGLATGNVTAATVDLKWNAATNATGYTIKYGTSAGNLGQSTSSTTPSITVGGLSPGTTYFFQVQATPAAASAGWAGPASATTSAAAAPAPTPAPTPGPAPAPAPTGQHFIYVTVVPWTAHNTPWNSTLWGIATHYHVAGGYQALAQLNGISNPSLIHPGQQIKVPQ